MEAAPEILAHRRNLLDLQIASLRLVALLVGLVGYVWLVFAVWPATGERAVPATWAGCGILLLSTGFSYWQRRRHATLASGALVTGTLVAVACALLAFRLTFLVFLFILPVIFAGVLLGRHAVLPAAGIGGLLGGLISVQSLGLKPASLELWLPIAVVAFVAVASWLSARNLYIALGWVWNGYERAHANERLARQQQGELRRALKALDEASYRLERANYMLGLARDEAEQARRLKQQFAQTISHELRTPLNLIVGFTELMAHSPEFYESPLPPAYLRDLGIVYRNACHLQALVNDVLDLARIEAAQMSLVLEECDPAALVREAVETARSLVEARGLELRTEIEPALPSLHIDPTRIRQVLFNLLNNAARFTERGSVTVRAGKRGKDLVVSVADTGVGIAPEHLPIIFEEFQQADGGTRRRHEGAGLGLAISRRFVELHGGRIWAESEVGRGSTFYFSLPLQGMDTATAPAGRTLGASAAAAPNTEPVLLAVTRSPAAATLLTRYVHGVRTVTVPDLEQAQRAALQIAPQVVILDRASAAPENVALDHLAREWGLAQTAFVTCPLPGEESLRQQLAVDGYLIKPVSRPAVWDILRRLGAGVDRVLVVDDDQDFALLLSRMLEDSPVRRYQVMTAGSGREALAIVQRRPPDLLFLDLVLPDIEGLQVIAHIRNLDPPHPFPIVVITGQDETDRSRALPGTLTIAKAEGLLPGEIVRWVQSVVDTNQN